MIANSAATNTPFTKINKAVMRTGTSSTMGPLAIALSAAVMLSMNPPPIGGNSDCLCVKLILQFAEYLPYQVFVGD